MKSVKDGRYVIKLRGSTDEPCSIVLNLLKFVNELLRTVSEQGTAVIDSGQDKSRDQCLESILQFKIVDLTGAGDMLLKREILVEGNAQAADR